VICKSVCTLIQSSIGGPLGRTAYGGRFWEGFGADPVSLVLRYFLVSVLIFEQSTLLVWPAIRLLPVHRLLVSLLPPSTLLVYVYSHSSPGWKLRELLQYEQETFRSLQSAASPFTLATYNNTNTISSNIDDRTLHELYLPGFAEAVRAGVG